MQLIARASTTVRNKNILLTTLCVAFAFWFAYDGYIGWPARNDELVHAMKRMIIDNRLDKVHEKTLDAWKGFNNSTAEEREAMYKIADAAHVEGWKTDLDLNMQRYITAGLAVVSVGAIGWFIRCQRRRVIADFNGLSPAPGVLIPWDKITKVDNTRWKKGFVEITYTDELGNEDTALLDDYIVERPPLIEILKELDARATKAEFLPKQEPAAG